MLLHVNEAGIYGGQNKIGVHVYHVHTKWYPSVRVDESYTWTWEQVKWRSMSKQNRRWTSTSCWHCNACMILCLKGMHEVKHIWMSRSKQNRRCTSMSCWHCNACMIICWKGMAFAGHCTQSGTHQWGSTNKIQVKHDVGSRLWEGQGQIQ